MSHEYEAARKAKRQQRFRSLADHWCQYVATEDDPDCLGTVQNTTPHLEKEANPLFPKGLRSGGGGDRTRVAIEPKPLEQNDLEKPGQGLAAQWLQLAVANDRDLALIVMFVERWPLLSEKQKQKIELIVVHQ